jgi:hypothetical protein
VQIGKDFLREEYASFQDELDQAQVVNLSLGYQIPTVSQSSFQEIGGNGPVLSFDQLMENYHVRSQLFQDMFALYQDTLFVAAAGNGFNIGGMSTAGIPLTQRYQVFPAFYEHPNLVKVASVNSNRLEHDSLETYQLADYSNYSVFRVELAAPVETSEKGEVLSGTSFAAPYVTRLSYKLKQGLPHLTPAQLIELMIKSSYVINLERAIWITQDWLTNGENSALGKLEASASFAQREAARQELGHVMLVKSGGPVVSEVALKSALLLSQNPELSIEDACLSAQAEVLAASPERLEQLISFWRFRGL